MKVLVVAKAPVAGQSKTRLCPPLNHDQAAQVAAAALADTLDAVAACGADQRWIALAGPRGDWLPPGFTVIEQRGVTFNERLAHAWADVGGPTLQIGMDTPQLGPDDLDAACGALMMSAGSVLGPATDGGWWALGLLHSDARVFDGVVMNTANTGREQRDRLASLGLDPELLPVRMDVDYWQDAVDVAQLRRSGHFSEMVSRLSVELAGSVGPTGGTSHPAEESA